MYQKFDQILLREKAPVSAATDLAEPAGLFDLEVATISLVAVESLRKTSVAVKN